MIKRINAFPLGKGRDPDKVWKYWVEVHAQHIKNIPGLKKYVINRVTKVLPGPDGVKRAPKFWGLVELWFDSEEDLNKAVKSKEYRGDEKEGESFPDLVGEPPRLAYVEEKVIFDITK